MTTYQRRADYGDLPLPTKLGILEYEVTIAVTDEERAVALAAVDHMKFTMSKFESTPAPEGGMISNPNHDAYQQSWRQ